MLVQAFILCPMDYCISLFYGITEGLMSQPAAICPECGCTSGVWQWLSAV